MSVEQLCHWSASSTYMTEPEPGICFQIPEAHNIIIIIIIINAQIKVTLSQ